MSIGHHKLTKEVVTSNEILDTVGEAEKQQAARRIGQTKGEGDPEREAS